MVLKGVNLYSLWVYVLATDIGSLHIANYWLTRINTAGKYLLHFAHRLMATEYASPDKIYCSIHCSFKFDTMSFIVDKANICCACT